MNGEGQSKADFLAFINLTVVLQHPGAQNSHNLSSNIKGKPLDQDRAVPRELTGLIDLCPVEFVSPGPAETGPWQHGVPCSPAFEIRLDRPLYGSWLAGLSHLYRPRDVDPGFAVDEEPIWQAAGMPVIIRRLDSRHALPLPTRWLPAARAPGRSPRNSPQKT